MVLFVYLLIRFSKTDEQRERGTSRRQKRNKLKVGLVELKV